MTMDPETIYRQIGRLIETMPDLSTQPDPDNLVSKPLTLAEHQWIGRADALIGASGDLVDVASWRSAVSGLQHPYRQPSIETMLSVLCRLLARAELKVPAGTAGAFIPVGNSFDAFAAVSKVMQTAKHDILLVDPYLDETALTDFGTTIPDGVTLRLLADTEGHKASLHPAATRWRSQYGATRPLAVRLAPARTLHDRAIFVDGVVAWTITQSLNGLAKRSPAEIVRADDTAAMKMPAYEAIWSTATVVV